MMLAALRRLASADPESLLGEALALAALVAALVAGFSLPALA